MSSFKMSVHEQAGVSLEKELSLNKLLILVEKDHFLLEEGDINSNEEIYMEKVNKNLGRLKLLERAVKELGLFSSNEDIKEVNPTHLNFLMINYYLGYFYSKFNKLEERKEALNQSKNQYLTFFKVQKEFGLVEEKIFQKLNNNDFSKQSLTREEKIQKFKEEKLMKQKLKELNELLELNQELNEEDEELVREYTLLKIKYYISKCIDEFRLIEQEFKLISEFTPTKDDKVEEDLSWRLDNLVNLSNDNKSALLDKSGKPLRPFVITSKHEEIKDRVFKPGYNLPTMTVEEYLQIEMDRGNFLSGGAGDRPTKQEIDDLDFDALDKETEKQREWDEFKDFNPRGSGNTYNKG